MAAKHNARTEDLYVKFAAVLNEKKRKAEELKRSLDDAQATLQVFAARVLDLALSFHSLCRLGTARTVCAAAQRPHQCSLF